jgi:hypothetical protein
LQASRKPYRDVSKHVLQRRCNTLIFNDNPRNLRATDVVTGQPVDFASLQVLPSPFSSSFPSTMQEPTMTTTTRPTTASSAPEPRRYLNSEEAARILRLSARTLERMRVEGSGPRYLKAGRGTRARVLYRPADLDQWLESRSFSSTSEYVG